MKAIVLKQYRIAFVLIFLLYIFIAILVSGFYNTIPLIFKYAGTVNWIDLDISITFSIIIGLLVAANSIATYVNYKQRQACRKEATVATLGTVTGFAAGICPLCVTGLFPLILGLFGISFSFASLPFKGLEVQFLSIILLALSLWLMMRRQ
jgi:hypothetical protein